MVGLGASAGGLEALRSFFNEVAVNSGMAFIVVVHMAPKQPSLMPELLQKVTPVSVSVAKDGQTIEPDHIYVIAPDKEIRVFEGKFQLLDVLDKRATLPIDQFLRSLAHDRGANAAAVILSGTGTDGTLGAKEIKAKGGLVLVQSEDSAGYDGMPRSAANSGVADIIVAPEEMPQRLSHYFSHPEKALKKQPAAASDQRDWLSKIFAILRTQIGHDFSLYKNNTLLRRIKRRMELNQIAHYEQYVRYLRENPAEVQALFRELLIGVTHFFRDASSFQALKANILPDLLGRINADGTFRAWIPGCSTGEEVYSLAIVIRELLDTHPHPINLQLFGTDIDDHAIDKARQGLFPAGIAADVGDDRLKRFFIKEGESFRIRKEIRDCAVFSVQDLIKDPPFSRLHLLCCRNLLIYLNSEAQKKLLPLFHYTLTPEGILMLGSSESIGGFSNLFTVLDKKWKIYKRREVPQALRQQVDFPSGPSAPDMVAEGALADRPAKQKVNIAQMTQQAILDQFAPTAILVDANGNMLHVQGRTGKYLETPSGPPTRNILDMTREGLRIGLSSAIRAARSSDKPVQRRKIAVKVNGNIQLVDLHVSPQHAPEALSGCLLVVFEDAEAAIAQGSPPGDEGHLHQEANRIAELERELQNTRESHQIIVEELESSNEELKSINEEMQSSNEEFQSTNEELESSREELQSLNEELQTVNAELQSKVEELSAVHDDMRNLLNSTEIATIFVDNNMRIRRFTPEATTIINLIQTDIGRPLQHVVSNLSYKGMIDDLDDVRKNLAPKEVEVQTTDGQWYKMRILPYRTTDNRIDGAVLTFASITEQKSAQQLLSTSNLEMQQAGVFIRKIFDMNADPLVVLEQEGTIVLANSAFTDIVKTNPEKVTGMDIFKINSRRLWWADLTANLKGALEKRNNFEIITGKRSSSKTKGAYRVIGQIIRLDDDWPHCILLRFAKIG
ncbi:chemotaxis protein CheR [Desulfosarcina ovata subsp. sediminis]|uniref:Chemotaxis protein CheR n=1 Tax=Desulfosarcina ovata subsp. sediminis TaxID=885957 RepID=A0A5K7ZSL6_9BACT|nr:chemotaxis protein CheB [Desulfosarcina ovata]BBO83203.1 chemotaxis protein CheR [Desulfosarcina ovata subsp. sediminis]